VDLSLVTGTIDGFVVSNRASVRSSLEHLQRAFFLDIVESSGKIRFVPRGQAVAATIPINDLIPQGETQALFAAVMAFWFGQRALRGR
jgi:hypothetical protein